MSDVPQVPDHPPADGAPPVPPSDVLEGRLPAVALGVVRRRAWTYLAPMGAVAVLGALASVARTVVSAWSTPTMLRDGAFVSTATSPSAAVLAVLGVAVVGLGALTARATLVAALLAAGDVMGHHVPAAGARTEVHRRRGLWAAWTAILVVLGALTAVVVPVLLDVQGWPLAVVALAVVAAAAEVLARWVAVALTHGVGLGAAARRMRALRRAWPQAGTVAFRRPPGPFLLLLALPVAAAAWAVGEGVGRLLSPWAEAASLTAAVVLAVPLPVWLMVGASGLHVRITRFVARQGGHRVEPLAWSGVDRAAAVAPARAARRPWSGVAARARAAVLALLVAPAAHLLVVATNPTPAIDPVVQRWANDATSPAVLTVGDDVVLVADTGLSRCDVDDTRCQVASLGAQLPDVAYVETLAATADPDGRGVAYLTSVARCDEGLTDCSGFTALVTCAVDDCFGVDATDRTLTELDTFVLSGDVAAQGGRYALALVGALEDDAGDGSIRLLLRLCESAACRAPEVHDLGPADRLDAARVRYAPDGRVWLAHADTAQGRVRVMTVAPGDAGATVAYDVEMPAYDAMAAFEAGTPLVRLAVRDDGTPVLLHRDTGTWDLLLTSCDDAQCTSPTTTAPPLPPGTVTADVAVDGTGRPVLATSGDGFVRIHSCADRACTRVSSAPISEGAALHTGDLDAPGFLTLDAAGRPVVAVREGVSSGAFWMNRALWCREARCGL